MSLLFRVYVRFVSSIHAARRRRIRQSAREAFDGGRIVAYFYGCPLCGKAYSISGGAKTQMIPPPCEYCGTAVLLRDVSRKDKETAVVARYVKAVLTGEVTL